jgi:PAS domain S-box-containing protein
MKSRLLVLFAACDSNAIAVVLAELSLEFEPNVLRVGSYEGLRQVLLDELPAAIFATVDGCPSAAEVLEEPVVTVHAIPVIVLCEAESGDRALAAVRAGAADALGLDDLRRLRPMLARDRNRANAVEGKERSSIEQTLRETELHFLELFEHTSDAVAIFGMRGDGVWVCETMNPACERAAGLRATECIGKPAKDLVPSGAAKELATGFRTCQTSREVVTQEHALDLPSGRRWFNTVLAPLPDRSGRVRRLALIARDFTDRRIMEDRLRASEQRRNSHWHDNPLGMIEWDIDGRVVNWNPAAERIFGYTATETLGRRFEFIIPPDLPAEAEGYRADLLAGGSGRHISLACLTRDSRRIDCEWYYTPLTDAAGNPAGVATLVDDVTERNRNVNAVRRLNAELEQRVAERTAQLETANQELEAFCYSVSHDLRAPLRSIDGFSQALLEDCLEQLNDEGRDWLRRVRAASQRMGVLIDDLLTLSRVSRGELHQGCVDLSRLARQIADSLAAIQPARQVEWIISATPLAKGDKNLLAILMENVLGNAFKYTGRHDAARIEFGYFLESGHVVYFVRDDGAGFDPTYATRLFQPFQRQHRPDEFEGHGIGLATVQRIVRRHRGRIWAEGAVERGATFYFSFGDLENQLLTSGVA